MLLILLISASLLSHNAIIDHAAERLAHKVSCPHGECSNRAEEIGKAARAAVDQCKQDGFVPQQWCLVAVAALAESNGSSHPTCGAPESCLRQCGKAVSGASRTCRIRCTEAKAPRRAYRVRRCNDSGTSKGWVQIKSSTARICSRGLRRDVDPHNIRDAASCYAWLARHSWKLNSCKLQGDLRWAVAFARTAGGPWLRNRAADGVRIPRCTPNRYSLMGSRAWRSRFDVIPDTATQVADSTDQSPYSDVVRSLGPIPLEN